MKCLECGGDMVHDREVYDADVYKCVKCDNEYWVR